MLFLPPMPGERWACDDMTRGCKLKYNPGQRVNANAWKRWVEGSGTWEMSDFVFSQPRVLNCSRKGWRLPPMGSGDSGLASCYSQECRTQRQVFRACTFYFINLIFILYWSIIDLQLCCVSVRCIACQVWIFSFMCVCVCVCVCVCISILFQILFPRKLSQSIE